MMVLRQPARTSYILDVVSEYWRVKREFSGVMLHR